MKAKIILINWVLSFMGLCVDTERSPLWAVLLCVGYFFGICCREAFVDVVESIWSITHDYSIADEDFLREDLEFSLSCIF